MYVNQHLISSSSALFHSASSLARCWLLYNWMDSSTVQLWMDIC